MNLPDKPDLVLALVSVDGHKPYYALANYAENYWRFPCDGGAFSKDCISMKVLKWQYCSRLLGNQEND